MHAELFFDGGCRPVNPGLAAFACIVTAEDGERQAVSRYLGWRTNNYAEYAGLVVGLKVALDMSIDEIDIYTDSQLVEGHLVKGWRRNNDDLKVLIAEAQLLLSRFIAWELHWVPRDDNSEADALCTETIRARQLGNPWVKKLGSASLARTRTR